MMVVVVLGIVVVEELLFLVYVLISSYRVSIRVAQSPAVVMVCLGFVYILMRLDDVLVRGDVGVPAMVSANVLVVLVCVVDLIRLGDLFDRSIETYSMPEQLGRDLHIARADGDIRLIGRLTCALTRHPVSRVVRLEALCVVRSMKWG